MVLFSPKLIIISFMHSEITFGSSEEGGEGGKGIGGGKDREEGEGAGREKVQGRREREEGREREMLEIHNDNVIARI